MISVEAPVATGLVVSAYSLVLYVYFVSRVNRYAATHTHRQALEFAAAIRPTVVTVVDKLTTRRPSGFG
jgi:hypothetical protein